MRRSKKKTYPVCIYSGELIYPSTKAIKFTYLEEFLKKQGIYLVSWDKKEVSIRCKGY